MVDHSDDVVSERTAIDSRLRWHLHDLDSALNREAVRRGLSQRLGRYG